MKLILALFVILIPGLSHGETRNYSIDCESINRFALEINSPPLAFDEKWLLRIQSDDQPQEQYTMTMSKYKNGRLVTGPIVVPVDFRHGLLNQGTEQIVWSIPGKTQPTGIFSIKRLSLPYSLDPFIMYGWSSDPLTISSAMEYRCVLQGVDQF